MTVIKVDFGGASAPPTTPIRPSSGSSLPDGFTQVAPAPNDDLVEKAAAAAWAAVTGEPDDLPWAQFVREANLNCDVDPELWSQIMRLYAALRPLVDLVQQPVDLPPVPRSPFRARTIADRAHDLIEEAMSERERLSPAAWKEAAKVHFDQAVECLSDPKAENYMTVVGRHAWASRILMAED